MVELPRVHDLLWGLTSEQLPTDAPVWCTAALHDALPVVVRRAPPRVGYVPVGLRGIARGERFATWLPVSAIDSVLSPEEVRLRKPVANANLPVWQALAVVRERLESSEFVWGVTGSAGFELATGCCATHAGSDLDLLLRTAQPISRERARQLLADLSLADCRVDVQLQTPNGGLALAEWAGSAVRVMLKGEDGPLLLENPWEAR
ncbi:malonate decarboxylase holo-ACP synthase [Pseudomonas sp. PDM11]|uniref:malonate decarboxylase holo-ACP synthase n=1 Tax=Pseudomonas sp. PDM11 TaxID=2769309 RepID=UPI00178568B6|nr:malonate decarboxylase holo-ACP synthase [Pseudomonas sp. PDM11]MBD9397336.1 malonate decarboxylase holo-ACP synthase [Pseudomonas sp. PDM11]